MWRWLAVIVGGLAVAVFGFSLISGGGEQQVRASAVLAGGSTDISGFQRATAPLDWQFPRDFGPHPEYQTEWWYYTGNLAAEDGRRFGFQFTIFRRALTPEQNAADSEWRSNQLYMVHFTLTDVQGNAFFHEERYSRGGADLAGATADPYRVWVEGWEVAAVDPAAEQTTIRARMVDHEVAIDLALDQIKPPALQGQDGLSAKSVEPGNASQYYSLTRLETTGTLIIDGETFAVTGLTWKDHEFSTSALGANALGWDWFGLQFDDDREMMIGQIRQIDGGRDPYFGGLLVNADGSTVYLPAESFTIESTSTWHSPYTGADYPASWVITVNVPAVNGGTAETLTFTVTPQIADQELHGGGIAYWEGTVRVAGDAAGYGYVELTGYVDALTGRF